MVSDHRHAAHSSPSHVPVTVVDVDVHPAPKVFAELRDYLPPAWRDRQFPDSVFTYYTLGNMYQRKAETQSQANTEPGATTTRCVAVA